MRFFSYNGMFFLREDFSQGWARLVLSESSADSSEFDKMVGEAPDYILRCSFQSMLELGLPCNPQTAARLLGDRGYFFSVLPYPPESPYWNKHRDYGTAGLLWSWWMRPYSAGEHLTDAYRESFASKIKKVDQITISIVLMELWQMSE